MKAFADRAVALRERFKTLESVRGSGYHDADTSPVDGKTLIAPQKNGLPKASEQLVFFCDSIEECNWFVGDDAKTAFKILRDWLERSHRTDLTTATGTVRKLALKLIPRLKLQEIEGVAALMIWHSDWNDFHMVFDEAACGLQGRAFEEDGSPMPGE